MEFSECPRLYIDQYFEDKINQVDIICENAILYCKNAENGICYIESVYKQTCTKTDLDQNDEKVENQAMVEEENLNNLRMDMISNIKAVKQEVLERFNQIEYNFSPEMWQSDPNKIRDETFLDQYCYLFEVNDLFPLFELKCGLLIFSQYDDDILKNLKFTFI